MAAKNDPGALPMERELTLTRIFDAPRELVFQVWTDAAHLARWFGPDMFTIPVCRVDARVGGELYLVMRSTQGDEHPMKGVFLEVVRPGRLVFTNIPTDATGNHLMEGVTTVTFADQGGKTKLTMHTKMTGKAPQAAYMLAGMEPGWNQTLNRLGNYAASLA